MNLLGSFLKLLDTRLTAVPGLYGLFHIISLILTVLLTVALCVFFAKKDKSDLVRRIVFAVSLFVFVLEILKQINYSSNITETGVVWDFVWHAFPFQFCSLPMYVGILQGIIKKGKVHDALVSFLATYAIFAGLCVMLYPGNVFTSNAFICVQTMICHGTMIALGIYLMYSGRAKVEHKTILKAMCIFGVAIVCAIALNEILYATGISHEGDAFNMFYISRHFPSTLPLYSLVHNVVPFPLNIVIYFIGFSLAAYIILLVSMGIKKLSGIIVKKSK